MLMAISFVVALEPWAKGAPAGMCDPLHQGISHTFVQWIDGSPMRILSRG
jgi:hypothetical protein